MYQFGFSFLMIYKIFQIKLYVIDFLTSIQSYICNGPLSSSVSCYHLKLNMMKTQPH